MKPKIPYLEVFGPKRKRQNARKALEREDVLSTYASTPAAVQSAFWTLGVGRAAGGVGRPSSPVLSCWNVHRACQAASLSSFISQLAALCSFSISNDGPAEKVQAFRWHLNALGGQMGSWDCQEDYGAIWCFGGTLGRRCSVLCMGWVFILTLVKPYDPLSPRAPLSPQKWFFLMSVFLFLFFKRETQLMWISD